MSTMESGSSEKRSEDPIHTSCPSIRGTRCTNIPGAMPNTGCFFNVNNIFGFFRMSRVQRQNKVLKNTGGVSKKCRKTTEKTAVMSAKTKDGKVRKKSCKKEQERSLCDAAKLGKNCTC